jgi:demethylmenaquinone methyltransferase/2-methoxy-6-polyprenyl-1,4-benzoquinol methylase
MLAIARDRTSAATGESVLCVVGADMMGLPFESGAVHALTAGYALRNAPEPTIAIAEIARVLEPGGVLLLLDFYRPRNPIWRFAFLWYLRITGSVYGWLWHRQPIVYGYIAASIEHHMSWQEMRELLEERGFCVLHVTRKLFGGVALHTAVRDPA